VGTIELIFFYLGSNTASEQPEAISDGNPSERSAASNATETDAGKKSAANETEYFSADELSAMVQQALGRDRFVSQDLGTGEELGTPITDSELNELLGSAFRGATIVKTGADPLKKFQSKVATQL